MTNESKVERKARKARDRASLSAPVSNNHTISKSKNYVVCLKWGNKYDSEYVNKLYNMVKRNLTLPYEFVCFTENSLGINPNITIKPLPKLPVEGWWFKPMFFNPEFELQGNILFFDLDLVIFKNIDCLFTHKQNEFCIIRDFNRSNIRNYNGMNSSVFRLTTGQHSKVYTEFVKNPKYLSKRFRGDQEWIFNQVKSKFHFWPDEWIQSYKWEMRGRQNLYRDGVKRRLKQGVPNILDDTKIAVFHGEPNPAECDDLWVVDNWK